MPLDTSRQLTNRRALDGRRVKARLIDWGVISMPFLMLTIIVGGIPDHWLLVVVALEVIYFFLCEATKGYTVGKYLMGLRVIKPNGERPGTNSVAARNVIRVIEEPFLALIVMVCTGGRRQRIGDLVGTTAVGSVVYSARPRRSAGIYVYPALWIIGALSLGLLVLKPHEDYIKQVNSTCAQYAERGRAGDFAHAVEVGHQWTLALADIDPPPEDRDRQQEILAIYRQLDQAGAQTLQQAQNSPNPEEAFRIAYPRFQAEWQSMGYRLYTLGVTCRS